LVRFQDMGVGCAGDVLGDRRWDSKCIDGVQAGLDVEMGARHTSPDPAYVTKAIETKFKSVQIQTTKNYQYESSWKR
jgi:hypothetical protein